MRKKIWLINHYAGMMLENQGGRHYWFAKYLNRKGYEPYVFCANMQPNLNKSYIDKKLWFEKKDEYINTPFIFVKTRPYVGNGKDRVLNMIDFYINIKKTAKEYAKINGNPDVILASSVHPLTVIAGIQLAKYFGVKCIGEIRDLWPEAIIAYSNKINKNNFLAKLLYLGEKWIYKNSDALIFTQEGGADYIVEQKWDMNSGGPINLDKVFHINNGVDLDAFDQNVIKFNYSDNIIDDREFIKVIYTGSIGRINNLGIILDSAKLIKNSKIIFLIFGSGLESEKLKQRIENEGINNVVFKGNVNKLYIPSIVSKADINLAHWENSPILRFGESCNKVFEYLAAGKPIFYTVSPNYNIAKKYDCGIVSESFSPEDISNGIEELVNLSEDEKTKLMRNSRIAAKNYDFNNLTNMLIEIIDKLN